MAGIDPSVMRSVKLQSGTKIYENVVLTAQLQSRKMNHTGPFSLFEQMITTFAKDGIPQTIVKMEPTTAFHRFTMVAVVTSITRKTDRPPFVAIGSVKIPQTELVQSPFNLEALAETISTSWVNVVNQTMSRAGYSIETDLDHFQKSLPTSAIKNVQEGSEMVISLPLKVVDFLWTDSELLAPPDDYLSTDKTLQS